MLSILRRLRQCPLQRVRRFGPSGLKIGNSLKNFIIKINCAIAVSLWDIKMFKTSVTVNKSSNYLRNGFFRWRSIQGQMLAQIWHLWKANCKIILASVKWAGEISQEWLNPGHSQNLHQHLDRHITPSIWPSWIFRNISDFRSEVAAINASKLPSPTTPSRISRERCNAENTPRSATSSHYTICLTNVTDTTSIAVSSNFVAKCNWMLHKSA